VVILNNEIHINANHINKKHMKRAIFYFLFVLSTIVAFANQPLVRNFTRKDYKSGTQNWGITQGENNIMYFANNNGLLVYDGKNWQTIPIVNGTNVRSVLYDRDRIYASTFNDFGYFEVEDNGKFLYHSLSNNLKPGLSNELYNIHKAGNTIFFQGSKSVYIYNGANIEEHSFSYPIDASGVVNNILFIANQERGLFMLNGNMFVRVQGSEILQNKKISSILPYRNNKVLIVTNFDGVFVYDGLTVTPFNTGVDSFLKSNQVFCATISQNKIVYGTVQRGIVVQDIETGNIMFVNTYSGLQNNTILSAYFDNKQNLWLGLDKGIDYVQLNSPVLNIFGTNNLYGAGYTSFLKNNTLYFGTNQGLYLCNYPLPNSPMPLQLSLIKGMEGQVWCLTEIDNTLFCGDDQGAFILYPNSTEKINGLPGTWAFKKLRSQPDKILGCSYQGLFILDKKDKKWQLSHFIKGKFKESSPMFEEDSDGSIWFSHWQKGLFRLYLNNTADSIINVKLYSEKSGFPSNQNNTLFRIGNEIIFSSERGLYKYDRKTDKMVLYSKWNKLFSSLPSYIRLHEAPNGDVWCVSGKFVGLARKENGFYSMDSITYRILQPKIIAGFEHFNFIDNNNLILNTEDGFCWIDTKKTASPKSSFKVILNSIIATTGNSIQDAKHIYVNPKNNASFDHEYNSVRFEFTAPEYRNDGLVEYSYILENYDNSWSEFSFESVKEYNHLPRGNYIFKVRARNILDPKEATFAYSFTIEPAWYENTVAFIIYGVLIVLLIIGLVFFVNHRSKQGAKEMEMKKEIEIQEQKKKFDEENQAKKREIKELKNQQLQHELRHKSQELASSTMNLIRKNEILLEIVENINKTSDDLKKNTDTQHILNRLGKMERNIRQNIANDNNWKKFEENFDLVYENYLKRLGEAYPELNVSDKKICAYIKMDLSSKDMAPLLNMSVRSIETNRYRIRQKLGLDREINLADFLQKF